LLVNPGQFELKSIGRFYILSGFKVCFFSIVIFAARKEKVGQVDVGILIGFEYSNGLLIGVFRFFNFVLSFKKITEFEIIGWIRFIVTDFFSYYFFGFFIFF
jgi:hypothetical protein